jgi:hypothetical protein
VVALLAGCGGSKEQAEGTAAPSSKRVVELAGLGPFAQQFDADRGKPRLLVILSPT